MTTRQYTPVTTILRRDGPQLSSVVAKRLVDEGATPANARKLIQRAASGFERLPEVTFPHRDGFLYLPSQHDTPIFWERLFEAFRTTNSVYGYAIDALAVRGGSLPDAYFPIVSGSPTRLRGHLSADRVRDVLQRVGVLRMLPHPEWRSVLSMHSNMPGIQGSATLRARMLAEDIAADAAKTYLQRTGIGSFGKVQVRTLTDAPAFGTFKWDITAPSYLAPLRRYKRGQKGFQQGAVVADILLGVEMDLQHVKPFLAKTQIIRANPKNPLFLSIIIADQFSREALQAGKAVGHLMLTTATLFTKEIAEALSALIEVLTNAATAVKDFPDLVYDVFDQLSEIEGSAASMRGPLFELWLARLLLLQGWEIDGVGKRLRVRETGEAVEIDVLAARNNAMSIRSCEAKAHASPVTLAEVKDWLTRQVPRIRAAHLQYRDGRLPELLFEFWTTNTFSPEALEYLEEAKRRTRTYTLDWFDRTQVAALANEMGDPYLLKILNDFFLCNTASAKVAQAQRRRTQVKRLAARPHTGPSITHFPEPDPTPYEELV